MAALAVVDGNGDVIGRYNSPIGAWKATAAGDDAADDETWRRLRDEHQVEEDGALRTSITHEGVELVYRIVPWSDVEVVEP